MKISILKVSIIGLMLIGNIFASENISNTKKLMIDIKKDLPQSYVIINDYFKAKTCNDNFEDTLNIAEIEAFTATFQFGFLSGLYQMKNKNDYEKITNAYKAMNCGSQEALENYLKKEIN